MREYQFNRHKKNFNCDFTIEFNVKNPNLTGISEEVFEFEWTTGSFTNTYGDDCFEKIKKVVSKIKTWKIVDWSFAGRSNGWYALLCRGDKEKVSDYTLQKINKIIDEYFKNYNREIKKYYQTNLN